MLYLNVFPSVRSASMHTDDCFLTTRRSALTGGMAAVLSLCSGGTLMASSWEAELIAFAADMSGGHPAINAATTRYATSPPSTIEEVGFYGFADWSPRTRAYLATVSRLSDRKLIESTEDKYTWEMFGDWQTRKIIDVETLPPAGRGVFETMAKASFSLDEGEQDRYRRFVWQNYAQATLELEQQIAASGRVLMSVDATSGDTLFFALVAPGVARRWQERAFSDQGGYRAGLRLPMWDRFWDHLAVSLRDLVVANGPTGFPPGTRRRNPDIPMIT
jgi:hypothetical protein